MSQLFAALQKEWLLQWRNRTQTLSVFVFGITTLLLFSFASGPSTDALRQHASGFLWLAILLAATLTLAESFRFEMEQRAFEGLLLLPADIRALFFAKAIVNAAQLIAVGSALVPFIVILYGAVPRSFASLLAVIVLGSIGLAAPGTLYAGMVAQARARQALLPLLLFPLVTPVLIASARATSLIILGDPMNQLPDWAALLLCFDTIYCAVCGVLFVWVMEE